MVVVALVVVVVALVVDWVVVVGAWVVVVVVVPEEVLPIAFTIALMIADCVWLPVLLLPTCP